ncbi:MAG: DUF3667 domain-containing protein [Pseudomonadota bacterium]
MTDRYCARCGQKAFDGHVRLADLLGEALDEFFSFDSRFWRTFYLLLLKPGELTREFNEGRRARYLPPFRLYLGVSALLFLALSIPAGSSSPEPFSVSVGTENKISKVNGSSFRHDNGTGSEGNSLSINLDDSEPEWVKVNCPRCRLQLKS